jgi:hypothetical protein
MGAKCQLDEKSMYSAQNLVLHCCNVLKLDDKMLIACSGGMSDGCL